MRTVPQRGQEASKAESPKPESAKPVVLAETPLSWTSRLTELVGVGPKTANALSDLGIASVGELVWLLPMSWQDLTHPAPLAEIVSSFERDASKDAERVVITAEVKSCAILGMRRRKMVRVSLVDGAAKLSLFWFFLAHGVQKLALPGTRVIVSGKLRMSDRVGLSMAHPDIFRDEPKARRLLPRYAVPGVKNATLRAAITAAVERLPTLPDPVPAAIALRNDMPNEAAMRALMERIHGLKGPMPDAACVRAARERLAWAEAFVRVWQRKGARAKKARATPLPKAGAARARLAVELGFEWTAGQKKVIAEIEADIARDVPMRRLLLGDVGTGKTAVALSAIAQCIHAKKQAAILAPTGILAEQYMDAVGPLARATGARIALAVGNMQPAHKAQLLVKIADGAIDLVVGTHALLTKDVAFKDLALVVVDEQQRLGVAQRLSLVQKGIRPHLLSLSATPIPRTLALALLGDIALSTIDERPRGRQPVATELTSRARAAEILARIKETVARGERVFVIAPRIAADEDDDDDDAVGLPLAAVVLAAWLSKKLGQKANVALVHGGVSFEEKRQIMARFRKGEDKVLVGTTVLEVGVDVPEATLIVIVGAERFGLSQLHQLRGRVGRGSVPGTCILAHEPQLTDVGRARLDALVRFDKGRDVAQADLELRGAGDLSGMEQSGHFSDFMFLDPLAEPPWLKDIEGDADRIHAEDPALQHADHVGLALLRRRFEKLLAIREESG